MRITPAPGAVAASVATRSHGRLSVTAIVKATFAFVQDKPMTPSAPDPIVVGDEHLDKNPSRSLAFASDLAPYLPRADVLLHGHALAFRGEPLASFTVRVIVARDKAVVLNKRVMVQGARDRAGQLVPFAKMPLVYELAAGGAQSEENPVGVTARGNSEPNIVDPRQKARPVGFGPIARKWPVRRKLLGALDPARLDAPIPDIPDGFPWAYYNAAPEDQRIDFLRGDEWIVLEGMSADVERLQSSLPRVVGVARLYGPSPDLQAGRPLRLVADTLSIDADRRLCSVVFRGAFPISGEADLTTLQIFAGVESADRPVAFPASYVPPAPHQPAEGPRSRSVPVVVQTAVQAPPSTGEVQPDVVAASRRAVMPFDNQSPASARGAPPGARAARPAVTAPPDVIEIARRAAAATPFVSAQDPGVTAAPSPQAARAPATPFRPPAENPLPSTIEIPDDIMAIARRAAAATPFESAGDMETTILPQPSAAKLPVTPFRPPQAGDPSNAPPRQNIFDVARSKPVSAPSDTGDITGAPAPSAVNRPATPFERPLAAPAPAPARRRESARTVDFSAIDLEAIKRAPVTPFSGGAPAPAPPSAPSPHPLPAATPFERVPPAPPRVLAPEPPPRALPLEPPPQPEIPEAAYVPRDLEAKRPYEESSGSLSRPPSLPPPPLTPPPLLVIPPEAADITAPKTLGDHFLAAMARAGRAAEAPRGITT